MAGFEMLEGPGGVPVTAKGTAEGFMHVVAATSGLTDAQLRAVAVPVSCVAATNSRAANGTPVALVAATLLNTGQTRLSKLELRYPGVLTKYVWIFDKATNVVTATDNAHLPIPISNAQGLVIVDLSTVPLNLPAGLVVSLSSTQFTYTLDTSGFYARATWQ